MKFKEAVFTVELSTDGVHERGEASSGSILPHISKQLHLQG